MKLHTKIAGTLALPLALAVAAGSAQAYTVVDTSEHKLTVGGYIGAIASWSKTGDKKSAVNNKYNSDIHAGTSRLNIGYTNKNIGTTFFYEQQFASGSDTNTLRHAYFETEDGWIGGQTWSFGTNLVALAETIDTTGNSLVSYQVYAPRNLLLGKKFKLDDSMSFGVAIEGKNAGKSDGRSEDVWFTTDDKGNTVPVYEYEEATSTKAQKSKIPAVSVNFEGDFNGIKVFTAVTNYAVNIRPVHSGFGNKAAKTSGKDKRFTRFTVGTAIPMGDASLKLGLTHNAGMTNKNMNKGIPEATDLWSGDTGPAYRNSFGADTAKGTHASAALTYRINEKIRTNLAVEASRWNKRALAKSYDSNGPKKGLTATRMWLNAFYQADNGIEWGAELQFARDNADEKKGGDRVRYTSAETHDGVLKHKGNALRLQAKYAF